VPLDLESRYPRLSADISHQTLKDDWFWLWLGLLHLVIVVFGVLVVPDAHKLLVLVRTGEDERCDAEDVFLGDFGRVRWGPFEFERVDADGDGSDETVVELLVKLLVARGRDIYELPLEI